MSSLLLCAVLLTAGACSRSEGAPESRPEAGPKQPAPTGTLQPARLGKIGRLHEIGGIYLAGQPTPEDFEQAKKAGIKTVINLRKESETDFDEKAVVSSLGMRYVNLPYHGPDELTDAILDRGRELLASAERPLLLHCASGNRVGPIWLAYRVLDGGATWDDTLKEAKTIGMRAPELGEQARDYVNRKQAAK